MTTDRNRGLFYLRDSGGRAEMSPSAYVRWAMKEAADKGVQFLGVPDQIDTVIRTGQSVSGDLYFDFGVQGHVFDRPALNALLSRINNDPSIGWVFIPRRDRLGRPNNALECVQLELEIRRKGVGLRFMDRELKPLGRSARNDIGELIVAAVDYHSSGKERRDLANKVLEAQLTLARMGFSTGGRAPYAFRRWLVGPDGAKVRELMDGEVVRRRGHHVVWLPGPQHELDTRIRILRTLPYMRARQLAKILTAEGVPAPDAGRTRQDNGVVHPTSGIWHPTTITNIGRHPLNVLLMAYGRRSMGDQMRWNGEHQARELTEADFRPDRQPKVVRNVAAAVTLTPAAASFDPLISPDEFDRLQQVLDQRGATQRGKPRSRDVKRNPLGGGRVIDMNCGWPMYREPYGRSFRYKCAIYVQTGGSRCSHNHVDGMAASRFVLTCIQERLLVTGRMERLRQKLLEVARREAKVPANDRDAEKCLGRLRELDDLLSRVKQNMARARNDEEYAAVSEDFHRLSAERRQLQVTPQVGPAPEQPATVEEQVENALQLVDDLSALVKDEDNLEAIGQLFDRVNARLFASFRPIREGKRTLNRLMGGILTFGDTPPPVAIYEGPTARSRIPKGAMEPGPMQMTAPELDDPRDRSLGNGNRGDRI